MHTDRTIPNNKPDIIIRDNEKRTCMSIDIAVSGERNVIKKEAKKILKYKDLTIEIQRMWNVKTKVVLAHHFLQVNRIRVKSLTLRLLMSYIYIYIYGAPILDVSRLHTTTHHSR